MKWESTQQNVARQQPVVRVLSFYRKTEDGDVSPVASKPDTNIRRTPSESGFTSMDLKKSRARTSSLLRKQLTKKEDIGEAAASQTPARQDRAGHAHVSTPPDLQHSFLPANIPSSTPLVKLEANTKSSKRTSTVDISTKETLPPDATTSLKEEFHQEDILKPLQTKTVEDVSTSTLPKHILQKSSSFSIRAKPTSTQVEPNTQSLCRSKLRRDPERQINKLVLRVPSAASEYENKRVIHSTCVGEESSGHCSANQPHPESAAADQKHRASRRSIVKRDSGYSVSHLIDGAYFSFEQDDPVKILADSEDVSAYRNGLIKSESTTNLIPVTPSTRVKQRYRHLDFTKNGILHTISGDIGKQGYDQGSIDLQERWKTGPSLIGTSSDVGSTSLSNFSSGDGLSTPTHMGSTTRLIYSNKARKKQILSDAVRSSEVGLVKEPQDVFLARKICITDITPIRYFYFDDDVARLISTAETEVGIHHKILTGVLDLHEEEMGLVVDIQTETSQEPSALDRMHSVQTSANNAHQGQPPFRNSLLVNGIEICRTAYQPEERENVITELDTSTEKTIEEVWEEISLNLWDEDEDISILDEDEDIEEEGTKQETQGSAAEYCAVSDLVDKHLMEILKVEIEKILNDQQEREEEDQHMDDGRKTEFYVGDDRSSGIVNFGFEEDLEETESKQSAGRVCQGEAAVSRWRCSWTEHVSTCCSIMALAGSLGNLLRLPRMVFFHGGGIFLLVYVLITLLLGIPLTFLEIGLGQFCQHGTIKFWRAVNLFRGVGYISVLLSFLTGMYYSMYSATALSMLAWSAKGPIPFFECNAMNASTTSPYLMGEQCLSRTFLTPVSEEPVWFGLNVAFLFLLWVLILACMLRKSQSYKLAVVFIFPVLVAILIALLVEAASRSWAGLSILADLQWSRLSHVEIWYFSLVEMLFSLQIGFGTISTSAGRIYPKSNAFWSAACVVIVNLAVGVAAVCLVYLWIGQLGLSEFPPPSRFQVPELFVLGVLYNVVVSCVSSYKGLWASFGFLLIAASGFLSIVMLSYSVLVAIAIETKRKWHWWQVSGVFCGLAFAGATLSFLPNQLSLPHLLDHYTVSRALVLVTCLQLFGFAYVYGCKSLYNDFEFVIGEKLTYYWKAAWILTPLILIVVEVTSAYLQPLTGEFSVPDDTWQFSVGWGLYFVCWLIIIACAGFQIYIQVDYNLPQKFLSSIKPSRNWGPVDPIYRHCWVQWRNRYHMTGQRDFTLKRRGTRDYTHSVRTATGDSVSNSFDMGGVNPAATEWTYKRSTASAPYTLDTRGDHHICWRKDNPS